MDNYNGMYEYEADKYLAEKKKKRKTRIIVGVSIVLALLIGFGVGQITAINTLYSAESEAASLSIRKMVDMQELFEESYLGEVDSEKLWDSAVKGFVAGLGDVYTSYMNAEESDEYEESQSGEFDGIGVQIRNTEELNVYVVSVFRDSPAEKAGMKNGDIIVSADDTDLIGAGIDNAVTVIRGESGSTVKVGVMREGVNEILYFDVKREHIEYHNVSYEMLDGNIGYIKLEQFTTGCDDDFIKYADILSKEGMKALIIDLRSNPGGLLYCALNIADYLMPESMIIYTQDVNGNKEYEYSDKDCIDVPVYVLINEESASASEVLSGALSDTDNAVIIGKQSYGKGVVQMSMKFIDGATIKFVYEEYRLPSGAKVHEIGITPDYEVDYGTDGVDNQLNKAIELINAK